MLNIVYASMTGGIVVLLWALSYPVSRKVFKASWHYAILKLAMVFMVLPLPMLALLFSGSSGAVPSYVSGLTEQIQTINISESAIHSVNSALSGLVNDPLPVSPAGPGGTGGAAVPVLQLVWACVTAILLAGWARKMVRYKKQVARLSGYCADTEAWGLFLQCKEQLKVRGQIALRTSRHIQTPFVSGLLRPVIVLPETGMSADEKRLALTHELTHIKHGDPWVKCFASVICAVHWFNPLAHLLRWKLSGIHEEHCDERVVRAMTKEERLVYGNLLLKTVSNAAMPRTAFCSTLSGSAKNMKRRLTSMMNVKKLRKSMIALSALAALTLCFPAVVYALAANGAGAGLPEEISLSLRSDPQKETAGVYANAVSVPKQPPEKKIKEGGFLYSESGSFSMTGSNTINNDGWSMTFKEYNGAISGKLNAKNGNLCSLKFSSSVEAGTLTVRIMQNGTHVEVPLGEQTVSLESFGDGDISIRVFGKDAKNGHVTIECA